MFRVPRDRLVQWDRLVQRGRLMQWDRLVQRGRLIQRGWLVQRVRAVRRCDEGLEGGGRTGERSASQIPSLLPRDSDD